MMIDLSIEQLMGDIVNQVKRMKGDGQPHGFARLVDSTVSMEKALVEVTKCQILQTNACLIWLMNQPTPFPATLLANWTEATNRWLESMVMFHWIWYARMRRLLPYLAVVFHSRDGENEPSSIIEAQLQTLSASASLAEAQILLITQILKKLQQSQTEVFRLYELERGIIQILESIGEIIRIMVRKHEPFVMFDNGKVFTQDNSDQEMSASLLNSIKKLDIQTTASPLLVSHEFIHKLRETLKGLIGSLEGSENSAPLIFHPEPPLPKPWLNEEIFGRFSNGSKRK